jgi:hypothetical protein
MKRIFLLGLTKNTDTNPRKPISVRKLEPRTFVLWKKGTASIAILMYLHQKFRDVLSLNFLETNVPKRAKILRHFVRARSRTERTQDLHFIVWFPEDGFREVIS